MQIHKEEREIYGELHTFFGLFKLLRLEPSKMEVPFTLRDSGFMEWFVVDNDGFGKHIWIKGDQILIKPYIPELPTMEVNFQLEEIKS